MFRNNGKRRASVKSIIARLRNGGKRRAGGKRRGAHRARSAKGRFTSRRANIRIGFPKRKNRSHKRRHSTKRRNGLIVRTNRRSNGLIVRTNKGRRRGKSHKRRNGTWMVRRNRRSNGLMVRTNPMGLSFITSLVKKVPLIGGVIAPAIVPAALGAVAIVGTHYLLKYAVPLLAEVPYVGMAIDYIRPIAYTAGGLAFGTAVVALPIPFLSSNTRKMIAAAAIVGGAAVDALTYLSDMEDAGGGSIAGLMWGPERQSMGDGGLWQSVPYGGQPRHFSYGDATDEAALMADYADASPADAAQAASDLSPDEGRAALLGARAWRSAFQQFARPVRSTGDQCSRHAAKHGHQWAWLCRLVGWQEFQRIVRMPRGRRMAYIAKLRQAAIAMVPEQVNAQQVRSYQGLLIAQ